MAFHSNVVAGYFADKVTGAGVDAVFFDEGDSFACRYSCKASNLCKTMPNATAWHKGDIAAWVGAAKVMAAAGKRAILSSQVIRAIGAEGWIEGGPRGLVGRFLALGSGLRLVGTASARR